MTTVFSSLEANRVPDADGVYLVGGLARRVNVSQQQNRSYSTVLDLNKNLIRADNAGGIYSSNVAVIGAGVCGLMVAATAGYLGANVYVFEKGEELGGAFSRSEHRYLHPNFNSWPFEADCPVTNLPFLNWVAGNGASVTTQILDGWDIVAKENSAKIQRPVYKSSLKSITGERDCWKVEFHEDIKINIPDFKFVFLCLGFGTDSYNEIGRDNPSYWSTQMHRKHYGLDCRTFSEQKLPDESRLYVFGNGDGGINECLQFIYQDYLPGDPQPRLLNFLAESGLEAKIKKIENEADSQIGNLETKSVSQRKKGLDELGSAVWWQYVEVVSQVMNLPEFNFCFGHMNLFRLKCVTLLGKSKSPFNINATAINRLMLCVAILTDSVGYVKNEGLSTKKASQKLNLAVKTSRNGWRHPSSLKADVLSIDKEDYATSRFGPTDPYKDVTINGKSIKTDEIRKNQVRMMEYQGTRARSELNDAFEKSKSQFRKQLVYRYYAPKFSKLLTERFQGGFSHLELSAERNEVGDYIYKLHFKVSDSLADEDRSSWEKILPMNLLGVSVDHFDLEGVETLD